MSTMNVKVLKNQSISDSLIPHLDKLIPMKSLVIVTEEAVYKGRR